MKFKFPIFLEIERRALEFFVRRLSFALYKPGEVVAKKGDKCTSMLMVIDGDIEARSKPPGDQDDSRAFVKLYGPG